jgi:hypothetical protein
MRQRPSAERHANSIPTEHGHPTVSTPHSFCTVAANSWDGGAASIRRGQVAAESETGGCSRERSGIVWLSKISSSPSRNGPASPPTGLSIIVSPR